MKRILHTTAAAALLLVTSIGHAADSLKPSDFALRAPLTLAQPDGLHVLELNEAVYRAGTSRTLADLRIFNAKGEALPWAVLPAPPAETKAGAALELVLVPLPAQQDMRTLVLKSYAVRVERDGQREVVEIAPLRPVEMPPGGVGGYLIDSRRAKDLSGQLTLMFDADAADYAQRIEILGSDDLVSWRPLVAGPLALNRKLGATVERNAFDLSRPPPFLRVQWAGDVAPHVTSARFTEKSLAAPTLPRASLAVFDDPDGRESLLVDVPRALPIERLHFRPASVNESFELEVYQRVEGRRVRSHFLSRKRTDEWVPVGRVDAVRVMRDGTELQGEPLRFSGNTDRLRLRWIGPPTDPPAVDAEWRPARIAFVARAPGPYFVAIGNTKAEPGQALDLATVLQGTDRSGTRLQVARVTPGNVEQLAAQAVGQQRARQIAKEAGWSRFVLWAVLLAAVAAMAWMAWRLSLQLRRETP